MKRKIFLFLVLLIFISGCSENEENNFIQLEPDEYFVCNYQASYQAEEGSSDDGAVLLNQKGNVVEKFPGGYIYEILTKDGYITGQKNGIVSKDDTLILFFPTEDDSYRTGVYKIGEEKWLIDPEKEEPQVAGTGFDTTTGRLLDFSIGKQEYDRFFEKIPNRESAKICYGEQELQNETDSNGNTQIVDKAGNTVLTAEEFYEKNAALITKPQSVPEEIYLYDVYNNDCWRVGYKKNDGISYAQCLCTADGKIIEIDGLDYLNINASFRRCKYTWDGIECNSDKYLILTNEDQDHDYYLKLEGAAVNLLPIPASEKISYQGQNLFLLQDGDTYQIYDGEKEEVSCKIDAQERPYHFISLIGPTSYFGSYTVQPSEDPETYKAGYKFVLNGKEKTVDYSDVTSVDLLGNGYSIILIKENGKDVSFIVYKDGSFQKKSDKEILWADKEYYMSYDDHTFSFYNMEDTLIKKYIIEGTIT